MNDQEKLEKCFNDVIWMAARYANGRSTYAPSMVRDAVQLFKEVYPDWELRPDKTILADKCQRMESYNLGSDWLHDLYPQDDDQPKGNK